MGLAQLELQPLDKLGALEAHRAQVDVVTAANHCDRATCTAALVSQRHGSAVVVLEGMSRNGLLYYLEDLTVLGSWIRDGR